MRNVIDDRFIGIVIFVFKKTQQTIHKHYILEHKSLQYLLNHVRAIDSRRKFFLNIIKSSHAGFFFLIPRLQILHFLPECISIFSMYKKTLLSSSEKIADIQFLEILS